MMDYKNFVSTKIFLTKHSTKNFNYEWYLSVSKSGTPNVLKVYLKYFNEEWFLTIL